MYAPIFFPEAEPVQAAVLAAERAIIAAEGHYHVEGRYFSREADANQQRRWTAERMVREDARRSAWSVRQRAASALRVPAPRVATWLTTREQVQIDAAVADAAGCLVLTHRDSLAAIRADIADGRADAVFVSAGRVAAGDVPGLASLVRAFPAVTFAGFVSGIDGADVVAGALLLGMSGVRVALDCRTPRGWAAMRGTFAPRHLPDSFLRACAASVLADVRGDGDGIQIADGLAHFFVLAFSPDLTSGKLIADRLHVPTSTLLSRFFRAGLPSPKRYVALARLTWAAWLGEQPGLSLSAIAYRLDASSPQSFHRMVRTLTGRSASEFRRMTTGAAMLDQYRAELVLPYREILRVFDPTATSERPIRARSMAGAASPLAIGRVA